MKEKPIKISLMKQRITLLVLLCYVATTAQVKKIKYEFAKQTTTFYKNEKEEETTHSFLKEKDHLILIEITDYNPLRYDFTVNYSEPVSFYQSKPSNFTFFGETSPIKAAEIKIDTSAGNPKVNFPDLDQEKPDPKKNFKVFNDALVNIKSTIEILKSRKSITKQEITTELSPFVDKATNDEEPMCEGLNCATNLRIRKQKLIDAINDGIVSMEKTIEAENKKKKKDQKKIDSITVEITEYKALTQKIEDKISADLDTIINEYGKLAGLEYATYKRIAIDDTDEIKFELTGSDSYLNKTIDKQLIAKMKVSKAIKISYSTGGFWAANLFDEDYTKKITLSTNDDGSEKKEYTLHTLDGGKQAYGAMGFINFHTQCPDSAINFGGAIGTGLLFNQDAKLVVSPSLAVIFGRNQRAILHIGAAFAQVERIQSMYPDDALISDGDYTPEKKKFVKGSFMVGLSWNLTKN